MSIHRLSQPAVDRLRPRRTTYSVRDPELRGFGVRITPSGSKRFFLHAQHRGQRVWRDCGDAAVVTAAAARTRARAELAALRGGSSAVSAAAPSLAFEAVAEEVLRRYGRRWKPNTRRVCGVYYRRQILPWFRGRAVTAITERDVKAWFASLRATPAAADRSAPILSVIFRQAEAYGYRPEHSNPCRGLRRYRRRGRERFLNEAELERLGAVLAAHALREPVAVAAIRLLLLTGCRKNEVLDLEWLAYREGKLFLADSKTGPRGGRLTLHPIWDAFRREAGLPDVRLHDLRHTYASVAMLGGETVLTVGRLLGHVNATTTLKYVHLADATARQAADRLGPVLGGED